jgi:ubiquitin carboxyl-terminal hydrolase 4/11/15
MSDPPPAADQLSTIQVLMKSERLQIGEDAHIIAASWFGKFSRHIGLRRSLSAVAAPGPINNICLMKDGNFDWQRKFEETDYKIFSPSVANQLFAWYRGEPIITAPVMRDRMGKPAAAISRITFQIIYRGQTRVTQVFRLTPIAEVHTTARKLHEIPEEVKTRLLDIRDGLIRTEFSDDLIVQNYSCFERQALIVDYWEGDAWVCDVPKFSETVQKTEEVRAADDSKLSDGSTHNSKGTCPPIDSKSAYESQKLEAADVARLDRDPRFESKMPHNGMDKTLGPHPRLNERSNRSDHHPPPPARDRSPEQPGASGLENMGSTCYMSSGLQCLLHSRPLVDLFLTTKWTGQLNTKQRNPLSSGGQIARAFGALVSEVWSGRHGSVLPSDLKSAIGSFAPQFAGWEQQDSQELVTFVLDGLHEDLNSCAKKSVAPIYGDGTNDLETAAGAWQGYMDRNISPIVDIFHGQLRSRCDCPNCHRTSTVFDPFSMLSLPVREAISSSVPVRFVPRDFTRPREALRVSVKRPANIAKKLHRSTNVVLASFPSDTDIEWGGQDMSHGVVAFEADARKFNLVCDVKLRLWTGRYVVGEHGDVPWYEEQDVTGPFLLQFDDPNPTADIVEEKAESALSCAWRPPDFAVSRDIEAFTQKMPPLESQSRSPRRFHVISGPIRRDQVVVLTVNPAFATPEHGFSLASLLRHKATVTADDRAIEYSMAVTLDDCFEAFTSKDVLDQDNQWRCPKCEQFVCAKKKMDVWSAPRCLIVHLKRFTATEKIDVPVDYPIELDMAKYVIGPQKGGKLLYELYAVSEHSGGLHGGHYWAHALVRQGGDKGTWYAFDDSHAAQATPESARNREAYVLYYERVP